jgi:hypothetical protein
VCTLYTDKKKEDVIVFDINSRPLQGLPPYRSTCLRVGKPASSDDTYSYAGGSVSFWQGRASQTVQRVGARLSIVHWSSRLGVGHSANNSTP